LNCEVNVDAFMQFLAKDVPLSYAVMCWIYILTSIQVC